uniref:Uncharacterized protein n=1 Tax=Candidatus Kentrum sp. LPFa TaxID=2126335 RepID=A0A450VZ84_9GAMM|nr:MAG: hypothetical protein BECKLPF1236A_GA0070988_1003018 [Candidatus Kentron sp. LPFa]VFK26054.1 MAG: hypothetical protein BECKLPF1236C_GA0070990_1002918 [Candidatus Kentron sp. LPFa]
MVGDPLLIASLFTHRKNKDSEKPGLEIKAHPPSVLARSANMFSPSSEKSFDKTIKKY